MKDVRRLLAGALVEICDRKPLDYVTVTEITQQAKLTRQVFYRHFADKYDLARLIHLHDFYYALDRMEIKEEKGMPLWGAISAVWLDVIKQRPRFYQNIYRSNADGEFKRVMRTYITEYYLGIVRRASGKKITAETEFLIQLYLAGVMEKYCEWILSGTKMPSGELMKLFYKAMPDAVRDLVLHNDMDLETAKQIAKGAEPDYNG